MSSDISQVRLFPQGEFESDEAIKRKLENRTGLKEQMDKKLSEMEEGGFKEDRSIQEFDEKANPSSTWKDEKPVAEGAKHHDTLHNSDDFEYNANIGGIDKPLW